jgi:hypothetical protein
MIMVNMGPALAHFDRDHGIDRDHRRWWWVAAAVGGHFPLLSGLAPPSRLESRL